MNVSSLRRLNTCLRQKHYARLQGTEQFNGKWIVSSRGCAEPAATAHIKDCNRKKSRGSRVKGKYRRAVSKGLSKPRRPRFSAKERRGEAAARASRPHSTAALFLERDRHLALFILGGTEIRGLRACRGVGLARPSAPRPIAASDCAELFRRAVYFRYLCRRARPIAREWQRPNGQKARASRFGERGATRRLLQKLPS